MSDSKSNPPDSNSPAGGDADDPRASATDASSSDGGQIASASDDEIEASSDADADAEHEDDSIEDDELDQLDRIGVDGVVAAMEQESGEPSAKRRRSPIISAMVLLACLYPLVSMWGDFRYWISSGDPIDLGHAEDFMEGDGVPDGYANRYVHLRGTPDVQWATVLTTKKHGKINYLRIREGGGRLFASVPRTSAEDGLLTPTYAGEYVGRMSPLGDDRAFDWLQQLFAQENVTRTIDTTAKDLIAAIEAPTDSLTLTTEKGAVSLAEDDIVRFVVQPKEARVLLGAESFTATEADAAIASLGAPFLRLHNRSPDFHSYVVLIPSAERAAARTALQAKIDGDVDGADHKEGVSVFPMQAAYFAPAGEVVYQDGGFRIPWGSNTTSPGYEVDGVQLRERTVGGEPFSISSAELSAVRVEQPIRLDPNGYIVEAGVDPSSQAKWGIMWLLVLGLALANVAALALTLRRRAA